MTWQPKLASSFPQAVTGHGELGQEQARAWPSCLTRFQSSLSTETLPFERLHLTLYEGWLQRVNSPGPPAAGAVAGAGGLMIHCHLFHASRIRHEVSICQHPFEHPALEHPSPNASLRKIPGWQSGLSMSPSLLSRNSWVPLPHDQKFANLTSPSRSKQRASVPASPTATGYYSVPDQFRRSRPLPGLSHCLMSTVRHQSVA